MILRIEGYQSFSTSNEMKGSVQDSTNRGFNEE